MNTMNTKTTHTPGPWNAEKQLDAASMLAEYAGLLCVEKDTTARNRLIVKVSYWIGEYKEARAAILKATGAQS